MIAKLQLLLGVLFIFSLAACAHTVNKKEETNRICHTPVDTSVKTGSEQTDEYLPLLKGKRIALIVNQTSIVGKQTHLLDTLLTLDFNIKKIFAPEHGFRGSADAGEIITNGKDSQTGIPIISLFGKNKKPTPEQLQDIDILIFDIQDVGARFFTYISTMHYVMEACAENNKKIVILDRPNPCDYIDGPVMQKGYKSFVGMHPIPLLHGCTVGELALMINGEKWIKSQLDSCQLTIIKTKNWKHGQPYSLTQKPSPNLPNDQSIALYPSLCLFEATDISIGRGTTFPFQVIGAPDKKYGKFTFTPVSLPGFEKNPIQKNNICYGIDLRQTPPPHGFSLQYFLDFYHKSNLKELFFKRSRWFDQLVGNSQVRLSILKGETESEIRLQWQKELDEYKKIRNKYILY